MKNRMMFGLVALLFLALIASPKMGSSSVLADTPRTREIQANEPKTPEDLLQVLKSFMKKNPQMNGFDIGEKLSGIAKENWGEPYKTWGNPRKNQYFPYVRGGKEIPPPAKQYTGPAVVRSTTPYSLMNDGLIEVDENGKLERIKIGKFKESFCLTPILTKEILGEPSSISLGSRGGIYLGYSIEHEHNRYWITIEYSPRKEIDKHGEYIELREMTRDLLFVKEEFPELLEEHKNSCATSVSITAPLGPPMDSIYDMTVGLVSTPRTREIRANQPKTPEDLLLVFKSFMENPQMSGFDIGEKILGIARENWGEPYGGLLRGTLEYAPYYRGGKNKPPPGKKANPSQVVKSTTPYHLSSEDGTIEFEGQDRLRSIRIGGFKETFCLTPALAREILGEPSSISLGSKGSLLLKYNIAAEQKGYTISIYCTTKQVTKGLDRPAGTFTDKDEFPKIFEERKNTCADGISIYSTK